MGFWSLGTTHHKGKSRRPKTNKTNKKVDNKAGGGHWEGLQGSKRAPEGRR